MGAIVTNIQRFAIHDGGGIRTTVFFKGCPLRCQWCHNPETWSFSADIAASSCGGEHSYSPAELARIVLRDQIFFGESGGVTISGGEPLAQDMAFVLEFLQILKKHHIHIACDTCGDVLWENFAAVVPYVDLFLYDIKMATPELHVKYTGRDNERIIANLEKLVPLAEVWLRVPVIGGVNDGEEMANIIALANAIAPGSKVFLLPYHNLGTGKWEKLDKPAPAFYTPSDEKMLQIQEDWKQAGFHAEM